MNLYSEKIKPTLLMIITVIQCFLLGSCTVESEEVATQNHDSTVINFIASDGDNINTRGARVEATSISYGVSASIYDGSGSYATALCSNYFRNINVTNTGETAYYWPESTQKLSFYAYAPYNGTGITLASESTTGRMTYTYIPSGTIANQCDFMTAESLDNTTPSADPILLSFSHHTSEFTFLLKNNTPDNITVNWLKIPDMASSASWNGSAWTGVSDITTTYTLAVGSVVNSGNSLDITGTSNHFFLIPQTKLAGEELIRLNITRNGATTTLDYELPANFTCTAGTSYAYTLTIKSDLEVDSDTDISSWILTADYVDHAITETITSWDGSGDIDHSNVEIKNWE